MERNPHQASTIDSQLPPELIASISMWLNVEEFVNLQKCNQQTHRLLQESIPEYIRLRTSNDAVRTLPQLSLLLKLKEEGFLEENRIGFDYASTEIAIDDSDDDDDDDDENDNIEESRPSIDRPIRTRKVRSSIGRIYLISHMMTKFPNLIIRVDAHCGTIAPAGIAGSFSLTRGRAVRYALENCFDELYTGDEIDITDRIHMQAWGKRVAVAVAGEMGHPFGDLARQGKGWVEIYVELDGMQVPSRPSVYNGLTPYPMRSWY